MQIFLHKFGTTLTSRQLGKEAYAAFRPRLSELKENETLEIDFQGVNTFSPSWGDEFLRPLIETYGKKVTLLHTKNASVQATLSLLEDIGSMKFHIVD